MKNTLKHICSIILIILGISCTALFFGCVGLCISDGDSIDVILMFVIFSIIGIATTISGFVLLKSLRRENDLSLPDSPSTSIYIPQVSNSFSKTSLKSILSKKKIIICGTVITLIIISIVSVSAINAKIKADKEAQILAQQEAEIASRKQYNNYVDLLCYMYSQSQEIASESESICVLTLNVWKDSIFKNYSDEETYKYIQNTSDFNEAISNIYKDNKISSKISDIKSFQSQLDSMMVELQDCPDKLSKCYDAALDTYSAAKSLAELAQSPRGNYSQYQTTENENVQKFLDSSKEFYALLPTKKDILYIDSETREIARTFSIEKYLNQPIDRIPSSFNLEDGVYASLGISKDLTGTYSINNLSGNLYISGSSTNIINDIHWSADKCSSKDIQTLGNQLTKLYGENLYKTSEGDGSILYSNIINDHEYIILQLEDSTTGAIKLSWSYT